MLVAMCSRDVTKEDKCYRYYHKILGDPGHNYCVISLRTWNIQNEINSHVSIDQLILWTDEIYVNNDHWAVKIDEILMFASNVENRRYFHVRTNTEHCKLVHCVDKKDNWRLKIECDWNGNIICSFNSTVY